MFPLRREQECETIVQFLADTVAGRSSKVLAVVGNCGCGKTSSLTSVSQCFSTREGRELYQKYLFANNNNINNAKERIRYPRLEYVHSAEKSFKLLLAEMTDRIKNPTATGGFFAANVAPNAVNATTLNNALAKNTNTSSAKSKAAAAAAAARKKKKAGARRKRKSDDSDDDASSSSDDDDSSNSSDEDDRLAELAKATANKLKDEFASALAMQACIGGVTNNYISGHGAVVEDYRQLMAPAKNNTKPKILTRAANNPKGNNGRVGVALKKRKIEEEENDDDKNSNHVDTTNDGVPFCFLVLDEIDTPGSGWRDSQSRELMEKILSVKSIGIILIANRTDLKWLPPKMSQYLTFNPYKGEDLAQIAKQKMSMKSLMSPAKNNTKKLTISSLSSSREETNSSTAANDDGNNSNSLFNEGALNYVGMFVAKNQAGDVRKVTDHCKTAVANKIISWHQQEQKNLEEKRTREDMERLEAQQNTKISNTKKGAKSNSNVVPLVQQINVSSLPSSTRTSTNSLTGSSGGRKNANASPTNNNNNSNNSDMMLMMMNDFLAASAAAASSNSQQQQQQRTQKAPSFSLDIKTNDVMLAAKSSNDHIGVEMLSALPDHVRLVMWCVANAVRVNQAAQELRQQNAQHQFQYNFNTNSRAGNSSFARNTMNSGSDSAQLEKNYLYTSYQNLTKKLNVIGGSHTGFGDALSTLVDMRLLSSDDSKTHYTLFVHQDEIKPAMTQIEKKYSITDELVKTL